MEMTAIQSVEKNNALVALANVQPSNYNLRKNFDEASLAELSESIRQQGVLQPIGVRPIEDNRFEIVFGERRYRAALMAGLEEIPAIVMEISDETAEEMAVTENLQRKDVTPIEEANAYQKLIDSGRHDVQSLAVQFGKNENYIRTRLKFVSLIPEIAQLLEQDEITISVATEICRYGEDIQREVYNKHLKEGIQYNSWRGMKAPDVARNIERQYTTDLDRYAFDKTLCLSCPHNTNNMMLFCEGGCGNCANRTCLAEMNASYLTEKAVRLMEERPDLSLCHESHNYNETVVERLTAMGYEVVSLDYYAKAYPEQPEAPRKDDYETDEEYEHAQSEYEQDLNGYMEKCEEIRTRSEAGEITLYFRIGNNDIVLCYIKNSTLAAVGADGTPQVQTLSPVEKLEKQDKRNKEIALEKTVEDTKKQILEVDMSDRKFGQDEDKMIYFFLLPFLRREHFEAVGISEEKPAYHHLTDEEKMNIIANLTGKQKAIIRRDFLIANFKNASGSNATASLLLDFAEKHMPEELAAIKNGHNEVYEKRHQRIEEKKAVLLVQEKAKQEAEQPDEPQPEAEVHTEEIPQEEIAA
ncbi:ParB/RepB/Spo0J family partition protein [Parabacteroides distasonis]|uniref:ParB/RepB/Spo0J family partition protein n=2 Tax=Parabacteroides distasonis TaxID=823 RepID=UPI00189CAC2D|nr:ParB/RepB/Spo0J family partition protein [Parabacteroides distasonis]MDB9154156.1 ParB/RepB/Spo0J family partition protein [Parabacteroides distasonis]MDB9158685.1 ParB/RepB/Spo0J family partition protein [Parabacteroides distasonis]MDB9167461.1 ParB/RepB/Spo0J family partition protein [Parabacteroides distasonis]MDB9171971.1 ParB/RepB/Spo0J family partition protein [Parabacteroides distasonis]